MSMNITANQYSNVQQSPVHLSTEEPIAQKVEIGGIKRTIKDLTKNIKDFLNDVIPDLKSMVGKTAGAIAGMLITGSAITAIGVLVASFAFPVSVPFAFVATIGIFVGGVAISIPFAAIASKWCE